MKNCITCVNVLTDDATHCYACNTDQSIVAEKGEAGSGYSDILLKVLCVLTILGAVFSFVSVPVALSLKNEYTPEISLPTIILSLAVSVVKLVGAIFMLKKKLTGLYVYTIAAVCGMGQGIYLIVQADKTNIAAFSSSFLSLGILIVFLVMYWLPVNRRLLS